MASNAPSAGHLRMHNQLGINQQHLSVSPHQASVSASFVTDKSNPFQCIHHWFEAQVKKTPDAIALPRKGKRF